MCFVLRLLDCASLVGRREVYEMADFDRVIKRDLENAKILLTTKCILHTVLVVYTHTTLWKCSRYIMCILYME